MNFRIALVEAPRSDLWSQRPNRFDAVAGYLARLGHDVQLIDGHKLLEQESPPTILTGLNRATDTLPMIDSHRLAHALSKAAPDIVIAPLRGGTAQGVLMARACGEAFGNSRIALWCDQPTRARYLAEDESPYGLAPLIADALERQCLMLADALILPEGSHPPLASDRLVVRFAAKLEPCVPLSTAANTGSGAEEIVFVGPIQRSRGLIEFIEAIERLACSGTLGERQVTFLGPIRGTAPGIGKEWLGLRATRWTFPFRVVDETDMGRVHAYIAKSERIAVAISDDAEERATVRCRASQAVVLDPGLGGDVPLAIQVELSLRQALAGARPPVRAALNLEEWSNIVRSLEAINPIADIAPVGQVAICVLHFDRLPMLEQALASLPHTIDGKAVELIVVDNASPIPDVEEKIRLIAGERPLLRVIVLPAALSQAAARNRGLAAATADTVIFLDDDNMFLPQGATRLARALATGGWDIVVSSLEIFDDDVPADAATSSRLIFLGMPASAGLFFNAFGDTAMAVRRDRFSAFGGFHDPGHYYPWLDWVTLAKAQARGLRIGALQWPAVRYRRDTHRSDRESNKLDQEGARSFVFEAYGQTFDSALVGRFAQKLHVLDL